MARKNQGENDNANSDVEDLSLKNAAYEEALRLYIKARSHSSQIDINAEATTILEALLAVRHQYEKHKNESASIWNPYLITEFEREEKRRFEEQKRALEERAERLRRMSFNVRSSESNIPDNLSIMMANTLVEEVDKLKLDKAGLQNDVNLLFTILNGIASKFDHLSASNEELKKVILEMAVHSVSETKIQFIPVEIYLDTDDSELIFDVYDKVLSFIETIGFEKSVELAAIKGSWFKRMMARSKVTMTSDEVTTRFREIEYGIEVNTVLKQQSEIDKNQSEALLNILKSVESIPNAAIRIGSLLVVKVKDKVSGDVNVQVRTLTIKELHILNKKPELLNSPQNILSALSDELNTNEQTHQITN